MEAPQPDPTATGTESSESAAVIRSALADKMKAIAFDKKIVEAISSGLDAELSMSVMIGIIEMRTFALQLTGYQSTLQRFIQDEISKPKETPPPADPKG